MRDKNRNLRKSALWQIYIPLFLGSLAILALGLWAILASAAGTDISRFADVSAMILILPVLVGALIPLALLGGMIYGLIRLIDIIPRGTQRIQDLLNRLHRGVEKGSSMLVQPVFQASGVWAGLRAIFKRDE